MTVVFLSLGSNIEREKHIRAAVAALRVLLTDLKVSSVYESESVGFSGENFYNLVVSGEFSGDLATLARQLKALEDAHGRERQGPRFSARTLDIDIVLFGDRVGVHDSIQLPRAELYKNAFVLKPMAELVPDGIDPKSGKMFAQLWQELRIQQRLWIVPFTF
jgi:2-amino-4-hydroxy-6-hydroxymethyldihydropteridine diphosphokinase